MEAFTTPFPPVRAGARSSRGWACTACSSSPASGSLCAAALRRGEPAGRGRPAAGGQRPARGPDPDWPAARCSAGSCARSASITAFPCPREARAASAMRSCAASRRTAASYVRWRVARITVRAGRAVGVELADGSAIAARAGVVADVGACAYQELCWEASGAPRLREDLGRFHDNSTVKVDWPCRARSRGRRRRPARLALPPGREPRLPDRGDRRTRARRDPGAALHRSTVRSRGPDAAARGAETAWAYTHVPQRTRGGAAAASRAHGTPLSWETFTRRVEAEVEAQAPGFRS